VRAFTASGLPSASLATIFEHVAHHINIL
jgi:hypothetical protein